MTIVPHPPHFSVSPIEDKLELIGCHFDITEVMEAK
jgi:hypothetical protein